MDYKESVFINKWKKDMINTMKKVNPDWDENDIDIELNKMIEENIQNPEVLLDNNYTHEQRESSLISVFDWVEKREPNPIIAGNGTFYKTQHEIESPDAQMLDNILITRKRIKKDMFKLPENSEEYADMDRGQMNEKINVNSYYGGSGTPVSAFYSKWSGPATTLTAQSVISTTETTFEAFLSDNFQFIDIDECFHWMNIIINEKYELDNFINIVDVDTVFKRIKSMFFDYKDSYDTIIYKYLKNLSPDDLTRIYYKNQLEVFTEDHPEIKKIYRNIFKNIENIDLINDINEIPKDMINEYPSVKKYNGYLCERKFMNPNVIPKCIKEELNLLSEYYMKYVYVPYIQFDKIYRLKNFKRKAVVIVDTDSNILNCEPWVNYCQNSIMKSDYGRSNMDNVFIAVNSITYILTKVVENILQLYGECANIPKDYRGRFNMKNEFFFTKLIISRKKKRYLSLIKLREGNLYTPERLDIKGFDFMKSETAEETSELYNDIVKNRLLYSDTVNVKGTLNDLKKFEKTIQESIYNGDKTYLPIMSAKDIKAYVNPYSEQSVRAVYAWNLLYPDNMIEVPAKINILKLNIFRQDDIKELKTTYPDIYDKIINGIFKSTNKAISSKGMQVIAIPSNSRIPEWTKKYIDYTTITNNILGSFSSVTELIDIMNISVGKTVNGFNKKSNKFTNIIHF